MKQANLEVNEEVMAARAKMIAEYQEAIAKLDQRIASYDNVLLGQGFVVLLNGFACNYEFKPQRNNRRLATNPRPCGLVYGGYQLFSLDDATQLAATTKDGAGVVAKPVYIRDALIACRADMQQGIDFIKGL